MFANFEKQLEDVKEWLGDKDDAINAVAVAEANLAEAKLAAADYTDENIAEAEAMKAALEKALGIEPVVTAQEAEEAPAEPVAEPTVAPDPIANQSVL